eukprot:Nk52_evm23s359 gene=Nk52_evmTU23s359
MPPKGQKRAKASETTPKKKPKKASAKYSPEELPKGVETKNPELVEIMKDISGVLRKLGDTFKANAYSKAMKNIKRYEEKITSGKQALVLSGVGKSIAAKIDEYLETGKVAFLEEHKGDGGPSKAVVELFSKIPGIGPTAAAKFAEKGYKTIAELAKDETLAPEMKLGVKCYEDFQKPVPKETVDKLKNIIVPVIMKDRKSLLVEFCGAYRRGDKECDKVEILLSHPDFVGKGCSELFESFMKGIMSSLKDNDILRDVISCEGSKLIGACVLPSDKAVARQIEIRPVGSTGHPGHIIVLDSEKEIFDLVKRQYVAPNQRH